MTKTASLKCEYFKKIFIDGISKELKQCVDCQYSLEGHLDHYRREVDMLYNLRWIREEKGRILVLGESVLWNDDSYSFELEELPVETVAAIFDELSNVWK